MPAGVTAMGVTATLKVLRGGAHPFSGSPGLVEIYEWADEKK